MKTDPIAVLSAIRGKCLGEVKVRPLPPRAHTADAGRQRSSLTSRRSGRWTSPPQESPNCSSLPAAAVPKRPQTFAFTCALPATERGICTQHSVLFVCNKSLLLIGKKKKTTSINGFVPSHFILENHARFQPSRSSPDILDQTLSVRPNFQRGRIRGENAR